MADDRLCKLQDAVRHFAEERDWDQFHTPKNLAVSLSIEAAELLEPFQWMERGELSELSDLKKEHVRQEMADVLLNLVRLADKLEVDLVGAALDKLEINRAKYPVDKVKGSAKKYNEY